MPTEPLRATPSFLSLVLLVTVAWIVAWLITHGRSEGQAARGRWLRFSVYGIFWLVLISAVLLREYQRGEQASRDDFRIMQLQNELDVIKLRSDIDQQQLRDQIEYLEMTLKNQAQSVAPEAAPSTPDP